MEVRFEVRDEVRWTDTEVAKVNVDILFGDHWLTIPMDVERTSRGRFIARLPRRKGLGKRPAIYLDASLYYGIRQAAIAAVQS